MTRTLNYYKNFFQLRGSFPRKQVRWTGNVYDEAEGLRGKEGQKDFKMVGKEHIEPVTQEKETRGPDRV